MSRSLKPRKVLLRLTPDKIKWFMENHEKTLIARSAAILGISKGSVRDLASALGLPSKSSLFTYPKKHVNYISWVGMFTRCYDKNNKRYNRYGGRGILVCDRWRTFALFNKDMGSKPSKDFSIDRIDNDGNYEPNNCRWADAKTQARTGIKYHNVSCSCCPSPAKLLGMCRRCYSRKRWQARAAVSQST